MRKLGGINFKYTYRFQFVLVIRIYFDKVQTARSSQFTNMFETKYYIKYSREYKDPCYPFFFLHNFKLRTEVTID